MTRRTAAALFVCLAFAATSAAAQTPGIFPVQGVLTDDAGALIDGRTAIAFALYTSSGEPTAVWSETQSVEVEDGVFTVYLGEESELDPSVFRDNPVVWLGITVEDDEEMPRVELGSVAFAAVAEYALNVPTDLVTGDQACNPGDVVVGLDAQGDVVCTPNLEYSGADFALADQICQPGEVVSGIDAAGLPVCVTDANSAYTGADFATSDQTCGAGAYVWGINVAGQVICVADPVYSGVDFAVSDQVCLGTDVVTGIDASGLIVCGAAAPTVTSVGGLTGGTITGNVTVSGDLNVTGTATLGNQPIGYQTGPLAFMGLSSLGCRHIHNSYGGWIEFPVPFAAEPIVVGTVDESLDNSGASYVRLRRNHPNRVGMRCDSRADSIHWLAMDAGVHTIDGKIVEAGELNVPGSTVPTGTAVFFNAAFTSPPVVLLTIDETGNDSGAVYTRLINNVTTGGFEVYLNTNADAVHWIAFTPGEYDYGRYHFNAGVFTLNNSCSPAWNNCAMTLPSGMFTSAPAIVATIHDTDNNGASWIRHRDITPTQWNAHLNTSTEAVHYVAWEISP